MKTGSLILIAVILPAASINMACNRDSKSCNYPYVSDNMKMPLEAFRPGGGSSGMVQISDTQYLTVYDLKRFEEGPRMGLVTVNSLELIISPLDVTGWDETGISSDLESICAIPGREGEYLLAESGAWQDNTGRIFHVTVDTTLLKATVLGVMEIPALKPNDIGLVGDQYEAITCIPANTDSVIIVLGERGGSEVYPTGIIRWGIADLKSHAFNFTESGLSGINVTAPGSWNQDIHRHITDFYIDKTGALWSAGCEDVGDMGPFYSVIYKVGILNKRNPDSPIDTSIDCLTYKIIDGFKIEALSGPAAGINSTHCFGTEDEIYGGVWRPIKITQ